MKVVERQQNIKIQEQEIMRKEMELDSKVSRRRRRKRKKPGEVE